MRNDIRIILGVAVVMMTVGWLSLRSANADLAQAVQSAGATSPEAE